MIYQRAINISIHILLTFYVISTRIHFHQYWNKWLGLASTAFIFLWLLVASFEMSKYSNKGITVIITGLILVMLIFQLNTLHIINIDLLKTKRIIKSIAFPLMGFITYGLLSYQLGELQKKLGLKSNGLINFLSFGITPIAMYRVPTLLQKNN